jgi:hypothetical protein
MPQVWYSAAWSNETLTTFHATVEALLKTDDGLMWRQSKDVKACLEAWKGARVPLATARELWYYGMSDNPCYIANMLRKEDRAAASDYAVTGDVGWHSPSPPKGWTPPSAFTTGSVVMFKDCEQLVDYSEYCVNENFLQTFPPEKLLAERLNQSNFVSAGVVLARARVEVLKAALRARPGMIMVCIFLVCR